MPPKRTAIPMLPWVTRGGQLTAHTRGVVFGMHIMGSPVQDIADRMGMTPKGVRHSIFISEGIVNGVRDEAIPSAPTTPSPTRDLQAVHKGVLQGHHWAEAVNRTRTTTHGQ